MVMMKFRCQRRIATILLCSLTAIRSAECFCVIEYPRTPRTKHHSRCAASIKDDDDDYKPTWKGDKGTPSYSDNWLLEKHNQSQREKQLITNSLATWNDEQEQEQASIREWQESFQRNGLADFTPPMSYGLNCLMVGAGLDAEEKAAPNAASTKGTKLPWEEESEADITSLEVVIPDKMSSEEREKLSLPKQLDDSSSSIRTRVVSDSPNAKTQQQNNNAATLRKLSNTRAAAYDCIVDEGLMGSVLLTDNSEETVRELLLEASLALREHGIYVLHTKNLTPAIIQTLESYSEEAGLEWQFELDGISDETTQISVARRYNTGVMPKVGRLSRFQP